MAPSEHDSPPDDSFSRKRRKSNHPTSSEPQSRSVSSISSSTQPHQMPKSKKFAGPISLPADEMDVDEVQKPDPFKGLIDHYKAKGGHYPPRAQESLHGGRKNFDHLMQAKKAPRPAVSTKGCGSGNGREGNGINGYGKAPQNQGSDISKPTMTTSVRGPDETSETSKRFARVVKNAPKRAFLLREKEYTSPETPAPSRDLFRKRMGQDSKEAKL